MNQVEAAIEKWNSMTEEQRRAMLAAANTAVPAEAMARFGYRTPQRQEEKRNA
jgi:predicted Fe-S protein YdhL (DUF1289 family)